MRFNWKRWNATALAGALFLIMALVGFSQGPPGRPPGPPPDGFRRGPGPRDGLGPLARDLNLTDDQKAQIKKITDSFEAGTKDLHDQLRTLHESEPDPLSSGTFDEAAVRSAAEARSHVEVELSVARAKMMSQIAAVLTTDQKAQLAARRQQFRPKPPLPPEPPEPQ